MRHKLKPWLLFLAFLIIGCNPPPTSVHVEPFKESKEPVSDKAASNAWWPKELSGKSISSSIPGVLCFRGNPQRNYYGEGPIPTGNVQVLWRYPVYGVPSGHWSGVGWTGQPLIIEWPETTRRWMNFLKQPGPKFEVICGALDSQVHFLDAETGKPSRKPLKMPYPYPIKGTVSVDPRGYPLLYVGCGINIGAVPGYRVFSLLDFSEKLVLPAKDKAALRSWPGSDSNVLVLKDTFFLPCENGLFYKVKLNSAWDPETGKLSLDPSVLKVPMSKPGMEGSMAVWDNLGYFADNAGDVFEVNLTNPKNFKKTLALGDDTDSSVVFDSKGSFYVGIEKDKRQGADEKAAIVKVRASDGKIQWKWEFEAGTIRGEHPVNGGILSTGALTEEGDTIFYTTSHHPRVGRGFLIALDTKTGHLRWKMPLRAFAWSSPIVVNGVVFCADSTGTAYVRDAKSGDTLLTDSNGVAIDSIALGANVESSPIVWKGRVFVGLRGGSIVCLGIRTPNGG